MRKQRDRQPPEGRLWKFLGAAALLAFVGSILWSMWVDTLRPTIEAGDTRAVALNLIGLPLILLGVGIFVNGGYVFVRDTFVSLQDETMLEAAGVIRAGTSSGDVSNARRQTLRIFWRAWKPGLARLGLGFLVLAIGGFLINA